MIENEKAIKDIESIRGAVTRLTTYIEEVGILIDGLQIKDPSLSTIDLRSWIGVAQVRVGMSVRLYNLLMNIAMGHARNGNRSTILDIYEDDCLQYRGWGEKVKKEFIELKKEMAEIKL